jgi:sec-independent protein translocase protein TatA
MWISKFRDCTISPGRRLAMGEFSIYHWLIVLAIVILVYGGRRIPDLMHGMGRGIKSFKDGLYGADHSSEKKTPHEH